MALECSYCQAQTDDEAIRCPACLRTTGLMEVRESKRTPLSKREKRVRVLITFAIIAAAAVVVFSVTKLRASRSATTARDSHEGRTSTVADVPAPLAEAPSLAALAPQTLPSGSLARARAIFDALASRIRTANHHVVVTPDQVGPSRETQALGVALASAGARFSSLDLARALSVACRSRGLAVTFAQRTRSVRGDVPPDPTGVLGRYVVVVAGHALDLVDGTVVAVSDALPRAMTAEAISGAMMVQSAHASAALNPASNGAAALALVDSAVRAWPDGAVPLAARAQLQRASLGGSVHEGVVQDLAAAVAASGDDPAVLMLQARAAVAQGNAGLARNAVRRALLRARAWGDVALASSFAFETGGVGQPCDALIDARESWTDDALLACRIAMTTAAAVAPEAGIEAARRLSADSRDPLRAALASAALGSVVAHAEAQRQELAGWLTMGRRPELAERVMHPEDAGP
ncbi:MAG: hypothetical protein Q8Q09_27720 [Deltaproteobacteria bacterium]|nr:hypothetical protein [Deltaproteobacteria bacterium]